MKNIIPAVLITLLISCSTPKKSAELKTPKLTIQEVGTDALLQAISIVDENTVWLSGHKGTFVRSMDGGNTWDVFQHPTGDTLQFRDIHAFDSARVILMSAGPGDQSRIFEVRRGIIWRQHFVMQDTSGFLDCIDFWDDQRGIAYGDAIDEYPYILLTKNGGRTWARADSTKMPKAGKGEGGFAASGTCVTTGENGLAWVATGAGGNARILITTDYGETWEAVDSPIIKGEFAGNASIDFVDSLRGFVTGGDLAVRDKYTDNCAFTEDGGKTWKLTKKPATLGAFYGSSTIQQGDFNYTFVCGPNGMDYTADLGQTWTKLDSANLWAVNMHPSGTGWVSGVEGKVVKVEME